MIPLGMRTQGRWLPANLMVHDVILAAWRSAKNWRGWAFIEQAHQASGSKTWLRRRLRVLSQEKCHGSGPI